MTPNLKLGCNIVGKKSLLRLSYYLQGLAAAPATFDPTAKAGKLLMHLNDSLGDCVVVALANFIQLATGCDMGKAVVIADSIIKKLYLKLSPGDDGLVIRDFLDYMRKTGMGGHKILAHVDVALTDLEAMRQACYRLNGFNVGVSIYSVDMDDFSAGKGWGTVSHRSKGSLEGGHSMWVGGYVADKKYKLVWKPATWATWQSATKDWMGNRAGEAHAIVSKDQVGPDDKSPLGENTAQLLADAKAL